VVVYHLQNNTEDTLSTPPQPPPTTATAVAGNLNSVNIYGIFPPAVNSPASVALGIKGNRPCYMCEACCKQHIGSKKM